MKKVFLYLCLLSVVLVGCSGGTEFVVRGTPVHVERHIGGFWSNSFTSVQFDDGTDVFLHEIVAIPRKPIIMRGRLDSNGFLWDYTIREIKEAKR